MGIQVPHKDFRESGTAVWKLFIIIREETQFFLPSGVKASRRKGIFE